MCTVPLPPGVNPIAVKYIISYHIISSHIHMHTTLPYCTTAEADVYLGSNWTPCYKNSPRILNISVRSRWTVSLTLHLTDRRFRGSRCPMDRMVAGPDGWFGPCWLEVDISGTEWGSVSGLCEHGNGSLDEAKGNFLNTQMMIIFWRSRCCVVRRSWVQNVLSQLYREIVPSFMFCWPCISIYACNETNLMHYLSSVYSVTIPLHVSGLLVAHHQEVKMYICNKWYVLYVLVDSQLPADSQLKRTSWFHYMHASYFLFRRRCSYYVEMKLKCKDLVHSFTCGGDLPLCYQTSVAVLRLFADKVFISMADSHFHIVGYSCLCTS
jgi:hypothetical protein